MTRKSKLEHYTGDIYMVKELLTIKKRVKHRLTKIERIGESAVEMVLEGIRKGLTYNQIAEKINQFNPNKNIKPDNVIELIRKNSKLTFEIEKAQDMYISKRADLILKEKLILANDMYILEKQLHDTIEDLDHVETMNQKNALRHTITKLIELRKSLIVAHEKIAGGFKDIASVNTQTNVQFNVYNNDKTKQSLHRKLAQADFKKDVPTTLLPIKKVIPEVVEVEVVDEK